MQSTIRRIQTIDAQSERDKLVRKIELEQFNRIAELFQDGMECRDYGKRLVTDTC